MKKILLKSLLKGTMLVVPIAITVWVLVELYLWINALGTQALASVKLGHLAFPGSGLLMLLLVLLAVGLLARFSLISWLYARIEKTMMSFPLVKTLYGAVRDFANMFDKDKSPAQQTALIDLSAQGLGQVIGFITNEELPKALAQNTANGPLVAVYLPMSYNVGGFTVYMPKERVQPVDWSFEEAMRFALTAGVSQESRTDQTARSKHP